MDSYFLVLPEDIKKKKKNRGGLAREYFIHLHILKYTSTEVRKEDFILSRLVLDVVGQPLLLGVF